MTTISISLRTSMTPNRSPPQPQVTTEIHQVRAVCEPPLWHESQNGYVVASAHGTELRDDVADGQIGRWDRYDCQAHRDGDRDGAHLEVPKFCREGNTSPGSGRARAVSAGGHIRTSGSIV